MNTDAQQSSRLSSIRAHIRGMEPVEFVADSDSQIVGMLQRCLTRDALLKDELVYLNFGEAVTEGLYFMASSLTRLEIAALENE